MTETNFVVGCTFST